MLDATKAVYGPRGEVSVYLSFGVDDFGDLKDIMTSSLWNMACKKTIKRNNDNRILQFTFRIFLHHVDVASIINK
jgi:hypothetical protein